MKGRRRVEVLKDDQVDPVTRYVDVLLYRMSKDGPRKLVLQEPDAMTSARRPRTKTRPSGVDYASVVKRLQAITNRQNRNAGIPRQGRCQFKINGKPFRLTVRVATELAGATCTIDLDDWR